MIGRFGTAALGGWFTQGLDFQESSLDHCPGNNLPDIQLRPPYSDPPGSNINVVDLLLGHD